MRNRAKCKLCNDLIESIYRHDFVTCKCGEISIDGGREPFTRALAKDWSNFIRVFDDESEKCMKDVLKEEKDNER